MNEMKRLKEQLDADVEFALFTTEVEDSAQQNDEYSRIYFGSEFCEISFPSKKEIVRVLEKCNDMGKSFTLVTPAVTDSGLRKILRVIKDISRRQEIEVVVNDFGILHELQRVDNVKLAAGRLLVRQKSDPRLSALKSSLAKNYSEKTSVDNMLYVELLKQSKIERIEIDNPTAGFDMPEDFHVSMYWPYVFLTMSPGCYGRKCNDCASVVKLVSKDIDVPLLQIGNTIYYENRSVKKSHMGRVDRVVAQNLKTR